MFFGDLEPYRYRISAELTDVIAVGWLCSGRCYPQDSPTAEFVGALDRLLSSHRVNQTRGYHVCDFCSKAPLIHETQSEKKVMLGSAEIWVPSLERAVIYAAPDLIYHYLKEHRYLPPIEFINGALSASDSRDWDANTECKQRLEAAWSAL